jgi:TPR repeat protein
MYANGEGVATNANEAVKWLVKAGDQGDEAARSQLEYEFFRDYSGLPPYAVRGGMSEETKELLFRSLFKWQLKSAGQGDLDAQLKVAEAYDQGLGTVQDKAEAAKWYARAIKSTIKAAEHGDKMSELSRLPRMLSSSKTMPKGTQKLLFDWFLKPAQQGDARSQCSVATAYRDGLCVPQDAAEAVRWYTKAAEQSNELARVEIHGMFLVAKNAAHEAGHGVHTNEDRQDLKLIFTWFSRLAQHGDAEAQEVVGDAYRYGLGVRRDKAEAVRWLIKSADQGYKSAQSALGLMFFFDVERGEENTQRDSQEMELFFNWFSKLADRGDAEAQRIVGCAYEGGFGVGQDAAEAAKWFVRAADQGNAKAQVKIGEMYMDGVGVAKNEKEAIRWFSIAADQGDFVYSPAAKSYINLINERTSQEHASFERAQKQNNAPPSTKGGIEVLEFSTKITERSAYNVQWSWRITLKNNTASKKRVYTTIQFVDKEGFQLESSPRHMDLDSGEVQTSTDSIHIKTDVSSRIANANLLLE